MSTLKTILRSSAYVGTGAAALLMTACAGHSNSNSSARYGNVYDYESGGSCNSGGCISAPVESARYGAPEQVVYADCSVIQGMDCGHAAPVYQAPVQSYPVAQTYPAYQEPVQSYQTYDAAPAISYGGETAPCPAGTTSAGDGTCMESSYSAPATTYSAPATTYTDSYSSSSYSTQTAAPANCPSGTTAQSDGTCMETSYSSTSSYGSGSTSYGSTSYDSGTTSYGSTSSYGSSSYGETAACPAGSSKSADGSCAMNEGTAISTGTTYGGYTNTGSYTTNDYMPIRK